MKNLLKVSEQLTELMNEGGFSQTSLADSLHTSRAKLSLYLSDKSTPDFKYFVSLIEFFNCSADFLAGLTDYPKRDAVYLPVQPFGVRLREILEQKHISQYRIIKDTKFSWNTLHGWLTGKSLPTTETLIRLSRYLNCSIDYILGRES